MIGTEKENMNVNNVEDYFHILPDYLLSEIISFLPCTESVRTSILSKRWKITWKFASHLNIYQSQLVRPLIPRDGLRATAPSLLNLLMAFNRLLVDSAHEIFRAEMMIDSFIDSHVGTLNSCTIHHLPQSCANGKVIMWIKKLLADKKVKILSMECDDLDYRDYAQDQPRIQMKNKMILDLPFQILSGFVVLELNNYHLNILSPSNHVSGNILTTLTFKDTSVAQGALESVLSSCSSLEILTLHNVSHHNGMMREIMIYGPILKFFKICKMAISKMKVSAVNLEVFEIDTVTVYQNLTFEFEIPKIRVLRSCYGTTIENDYVCWVGSKILELSNIPQTGGSNQSLKHSASSFAGIFENLATLCIDFDLKTVRNSMALFSALKSCPNLQNLRINSQVNYNVQVDEDDAKLYYKSRKEQCECINDHLTTLSIKGFAGKTSEIEFFRHIIKSAKVMKKLTIWFADDCSRTRATEIRWLSFVMAHPNLSIILNPGPRYMATVDNGNFETWLSTLKE